MRFGHLRRHVDRLGYRRLGVDDVNRRCNALTWMAVTNIIKSEQLEHRKPALRPDMWPHGSLLG